MIAVLREFKQARQHLQVFRYREPAEVSVQQNTLLHRCIIVEDEASAKASAAAGANQTA